MHSSIAHGFVGTFRPSAPCSNRIGHMDAYGLSLVLAHTDLLKDKFSGFSKLPKWLTQGPRHAFFVLGLGV